MVDVVNETTIILDAMDVAAILSDEICHYGALSKLRVENVSANDSGDFVLTLTPRGEKEAEAA